MSAEFYNRMATTASRLIGKFGAVVQIRRTSAETVDPITRQRTGGTTTVLNSRGIITEFKDDMMNNRTAEGTRILESDRMLILDKSVEPKVTDKITVGSQNWSIVRIDTKQPAGIDLVYMVHIRR